MPFTPFRPWQDQVLQEGLEGRAPMLGISP